MMLSLALSSDFISTDKRFRGVYRQSDLLERISGQLTMQLEPQEFSHSMVENNCVVAAIRPSGGQRFRT